MDFTAKDISTIIKTCAGSGVNFFECGELKFSFNPDVAQGPDVIQNPDSIDPLAGFIPEGEEEVPEDILDNPELRELELQNMMIADPVGYEKHMLYEERNHENS